MDKSGHTSSNRPAHPAPKPDESVFSGSSSVNPTDHPPAEPLAQSPDCCGNVEQTYEPKHSLLSPPVQMIGDDGVFYRANVESIRIKEPFTAVSIIGPQCSGKSYLLNQIFGTNFEVMNAAKGRHQTTKGIWLSNSIIPNFVVMDVEGSDGNQKQDHLPYERQIALLLLQLSNLIIVNMHLQDSNRQLGVSSTLLPTIFQEKVKINSARTNILVVIRDYDYETPLDLLQKDVLENMKKLWKSSITHESPKFEECFEPFIVALPDKSEEQDFNRRVFDLKENLMKGHITSIRQDFASKANSIWQSIRPNQHFDLPVLDHKVATSTINCDRSVQSIIDDLATFQVYASLEKSASSEDFWKAYECLWDMTSTRFDTETEMCDTTVRNKKRQELEQLILEKVDPFHRNILKKKNIEMQEKFKKIIRENLRQAKDPMLIVTNSIGKCMEELKETCTYMSLMNKDAFHQFSESFQSALSNYAHNEAMLIQEKHKTAEYELARHEMERKTSSLYREYEALQQELVRDKEELNESKLMACQTVERERQDALIRNQRAREDSQKRKESFMKEKERLSAEVERLSKKQHEDMFSMANTVVGAGFTLLGNAVKGFSGIPPFRWSTPLVDTRPSSSACQKARQFRRRPTELDEGGYDGQQRGRLTNVSEDPEDGVCSYPRDDDEERGQEMEEDQ